MHEDWGEEGCSEARGVHSQLPQRCQLLCLWDLVTLLQVVIPASKYSDIGRSRGSPGPSLAATVNWWWREALRADQGRNSLYCNVAGLRKQVWSDLGLGSLQVVAVCPVAAEEWTSWACSVSSCRFLMSSSRNAGRTGGLSLFAFICSSQSSQVPCKESIKWLHVMFCFLSLHPDVNVDSLPLLSLFLSIIEKNNLWTKPRLGNGSPLLSGWEQTQGKGLLSFLLCEQQCLRKGLPSVRLGKLCYFLQVFLTDCIYFLCPHSHL